MLSISQSYFDDAQAVAASEDGKFYIYHSDNLSIYSKNRSLLAKIDISFAHYPSDVAVDSQGQAYLFNSTANQIMILTPSGELAGSLNVIQPFSMAVLSNGNIVVASPNNGKLIHIYDSSGHKLQSIGDIKLFDSKNSIENAFLNRGKVVVDSSDNIYYIFKYALVPTVLKFSKDGHLISELSIEGKAINLQLDMARNYLATKPAEEVGSIDIINSAAIDPITNHLWVCMNGSSRSGIVYEYSPKGKKLNEYGFILNLPSIVPIGITRISDIIVRNQSAYILYDNGLYRVSIDKSSPPDDVIFSQEACSQEQNWPGCSSNCPRMAFTLFTRL